MQQLPGGIFAAGSMAASTSGGGAGQVSDGGAGVKAEDAAPVVGALGGLGSGTAPMHIDGGSGPGPAGPAQQAAPAGGWAPTQL